ncbi:unnamed protein product [Phytophthora fragariaefolia]|uniref:Unnamed protein product n=1 Tax=Phytophthora fragariaefolia TaxID=1490495 RepID=A0A9W6YDK7_9STRA|nr:unnamed protein product [Phytophthora fragariaefolia]
MTDRQEAHKDYGTDQIKKGHDFQQIGGPGTLELSWLIHERVRTFRIQNGQFEMDYDTALPTDDSVATARSTQAAASSPRRGSSYCSPSRRLSHLWPMAAATGPWQRLGH